MKSYKKEFFTLLALLFVKAAIAGEANPMEMARSVGFIGCDSLISKTFEHALKSSERRFSMDYFGENSKNSIDLHATWGSPGDTVWQSIHLEKRGEYCYTTVRSLVSEVGSCNSFLSKDQYFNYENESAGALWSKNKGGVKKIFIQSGDACNHIYIRSDKQRISQ